MLNLEQIEKQFPKKLQAYKKNMLREYLQYKIITAIFDTKYSHKLSFLGGTALRIIHNNQRFSEDLDFDNFGLTEAEFKDIIKTIKKEMEIEGYKTEIRTVFKGAYRCYFKIPEILFDNQISPFKQEKILIQIDTVPHNFKYTPDKVILNKFDVFTQINVTPLDILLAQKLYTAFNRKRSKGRDFFDIIFLFSLNIKPNYGYLKKNINVNNKAELKNFINKESKKTNFKQLAKDVEPFLFSPSDKKRILLFKEYINTKLA